MHGAALGVKKRKCQTSINFKKVFELAEWDVGGWGLLRGGNYIVGRGGEEEG